MLESKRRDVSVRSSNGWASGRTPAAAQEAARSELIERAVFLEAWNRRVGWDLVKVRGVLNHVRSASLKRLGWDVRLFRLTERRLGEVYCGLGTTAAGGAIFDCCHRLPGTNAARSQGKVLRSLLR